MRVANILVEKERKLITISPDSRISRAVILMSSEGVGALLVVDEQQKLVGVLSEKDIIRTIARHKEAALTMHVRDVASAPVVTATAETLVLDVMHVMTEKRVRHIPVMDGANIVDIISIGDVLKSRLIEQDLELAVLRDVAGFRPAGAFPH